MSTDEYGHDVGPEDPDGTTAWERDDAARAIAHVDNASRAHRQRLARGGECADCRAVYDHACEHRALDVPGCAFCVVEAAVRLTERLTERP